MTEHLRTRFPSRRRFVLGLSAAGSMAGLGIPPACAQPSLQHPILSGKHIDLVVDELPVNITGRPRTATAFNGVVPGPIMRLREGDDVTINVTNRLKVSTSVHWHGFRLPNDQDGVPGLTYSGIAPGQTFTYRFPIIQSGTYWYHSHSGMQEQTGLHGAALLVPKTREPYRYDREHVIALSDWTDEDPMTIQSNLKEDSDYYNYGQRTLGTFFRDVRHNGLKSTIDDRLMWGDMRMAPTDIMDVTGATYTFLMNGRGPAANWLGLFRHGEHVRLRLINMSSMTTFDVRIPGLPMTVVQADGSDVEPITVDELRMGVAETYDVMVEPGDADAYTIFAQAEDRSGYARGTLAIRSGLTAVVPPMDPRPLRTMTDMGMGNMATMAGMKMTDMTMSSSSAPDTMANMSGMGGMNMSDVLAKTDASGMTLAQMRASPEVDNIAMSTKNRLSEAGDGLDGNGRRVLTYAQLKALNADPYSIEPTREIEFHLTGNMERWIWGFDGKKFSEAPPVRVTLGETVRFVLINDTMMEHPIHLHGFLFSLENGSSALNPKKHTINVKPAERVGIVFTADTPGRWAFHCHLLYHMEAGMFRTVLVS